MAPTRKNNLSLATTAPGKFNKSPVSVNKVTFKKKLLLLNIRASWTKFFCSSSPKWIGQCLFEFPLQNFSLLLFIYLCTCSEPSKLLPDMLFVFVRLQRKFKGRVKYVRTRSSKSSPNLMLCA
jgi:hypothetical protein